MQALGARCLWFYEKFWGVFWGYDTAQRHVFSSEAHGIGSSFAQRHSYQKCFKILKARGTESAQSLWCMEFYFISHNMSQWGWVISNHQLVNGSKSISISNDSKTEAAYGIIDGKSFHTFIDVSTIHRLNLDYLGDQQTCAAYQNDSGCLSCCLISVTILEVFYLAVHAFTYFICITEQ